MEYNISLDNATLNSVRLAFSGGHQRIYLASSSTTVTVTSAMLTNSGLNAWNAANLVDGVVGTYAFHCDSAPAGSYFTIDFGAGNDKDLVQAQMYTYASVGVYATWDIKYSDNGSTWSTAYSGWNLADGTATGWHSKTWASVGSHRYWQFYKTNAAQGGGYVCDMILTKLAYDGTETVTIPQIDFVKSTIFQETDFLIPCNISGEDGTVQGRRKLDNGSWTTFQNMVLISDNYYSFANSGTFTCRYLDLEFKLVAGSLGASIGRPKITNATITVPSVANTYANYFKVILDATKYKSSAPNLCMSGGSPSVSASLSGTADLLIDGSSSTYWYVNTAPQWFKHDFYAPIVVNQISIVPWSDANGVGCKDFTVHGSNDDSTYTLLLTATHGNNTNSEDFIISNSTAYRYYKVTITSSYRGSNITVGLSEVQLKNTNYLTNVPVLLEISAASGTSNADLTDIFTKLGSNYKKIRVDTSGGTQCYVEVETWDTVNRVATLWVKVPSVSAAIDTTLYLYYDSSVADNVSYVGQPGSTPSVAVWGYTVTPKMSQWRLDGDVNDTNRLNNGTVTGTTTFVDGYTTKAFSFNGSTYISAPDSSSLDTTTNNFTLSAWVNPTTIPTGGNQAALISKGGGWGRSGYLLTLLFGNSTRMHCNYVGDTYGDYSVITTGKWNHITATYANSVCKVYINGVFKGSFAASGVAVNDYVFYLGMTNGIFYLTGAMENACIYSSAISDTEVANVYATNLILNSIYNSKNYLVSYSYPPSTITSLAAINRSQTSIDLIWSAPYASGYTQSGTVNSYDIRYVANSTLSEAVWSSATQVTGEPTPQGYGGLETISIPNLSCSTNYQFGIKSLNSSGLVSPMSNIVQTSTLGCENRYDLTVGIPVHGATLATGTTRLSDATYAIKMATTGTYLAEETAILPKFGGYPNSKFNWSTLSNKENLGLSENGVILYQYASFNNDNESDLVWNGTWIPYSTSYSGNSTAKTVVPYGNTSIKTDNFKFGTSSAYFDGSGDYLSIQTHSAWNLGATWTVDMWVYPTLFNATYNVLYTYGSASGWLQIFLNGSGQVKISTNTQSEQTWTGGAVALNTWSHVAIVTSNNSCTVYINGVSMGAKTVTAPLNSSPLGIGWDSGASREYKGYIDEYRVSPGIARWSTGFTPPTAPYTADTYTALLLHMEGANNSTVFTDESLIYRSSSPSKIISAPVTSGKWGKLKLLFDTSNPSVSPITLPVNMISNSTPGSCVVSASSYYSAGYEPWRAADSSVGGDSRWTSANGIAPPHWWKIDFGSPTYVLSYTVRAYYAINTYSPKDFSLQGSNDDSTWTTIQSNINLSWVAGETKTFTLTQGVSYRYFRLYITANVSTYETIIDDIRFFTTAQFPTSVCDMSMNISIPNAGMVTSQKEYPIVIPVNNATRIETNNLLFKNSNTKLYLQQPNGMPTGAIGIFDLNGNGNDTSGNARHMSVVGTPYWNGSSKLGSSCLEPVGAGAILQNSYDYGQLTDLSVSFWCYANTVASGTLMCSSTTGNPSLMLQYQGSSGSLYWGIYRNGYVYSMAQIVLNQWNHYVLTIANTAWKVYTNGALSNSGTCNNIGPISTGYYIGYGYYGYMPAGHKIDAVAFYGRVLNTTEVGYLYNSGNGVETMTVPYPLLTTEYATLSRVGGNIGTGFNWSTVQDRSNIDGETGTITYQKAVFNKDDESDLAWNGLWLTLTQLRSMPIDYGKWAKVKVKFENPPAAISDMYMNIVVETFVPGGRTHRVIGGGLIA